MELARTVIEGVAKTLADNHGIKVVFLGDECKTDGKTIYLPSLPDKVPARLVELLRGYLDHEAGHIAFTEFKVMKGIKNGLEKAAFNAVEDARIEAEMAKVWKGCAVNFEKARVLSLAKLKTRWAELDTTIRILLLVLIIAQEGWESEFFAENGEEFLPVLDYLSDEIEAIGGLKSSREALDLARLILEKLEKFTEPPAMKVKVRASLKATSGEGSGNGPKGKDSSKEKAEPGKDGCEIVPSDSDDPSDCGGGTDATPPADEAPMPGDPASEAKDTAFEQEAESGDKAGEGSEDEVEVEIKVESGEAEDPEDADGGSEGEAGEDEASGEEDPLKELREKVKESMKDKDSEDKKMPDTTSDAIKGDAKALSGYRVYTSENDTFKAPDIGRNALAMYEESKKSLASIVGVLKNQLLRLLLSQKRSRWVGGKRQGAINPASLHHVVNRTSDLVYRQRKEGQKINTAVSILIDLSGSMGCDKTERAMETTILLAETLGLLGIPFEILGFTGDWRTAHPSREEKGIFARWGSLDMVYFKKFDEAYGIEQKRRVGSMRSYSQNYDGESVMFAANRLLQRPEKKKVLFVLSDGMPCAACCMGGALNSHLRAVVADLERIPDFYLCGFGILDDAPKRFYRNHVLVRDLETLPKEIMDNLYKALVLNQ
jgi:cobalamin biosynthesis protein CobT